MQEIDEMFIQYNSKQLKWLDTLKKLKRLEDEGKIVLYAGTYSFEKALSQNLCDSAQFYFYTTSDILFLYKSHGRRHYKRRRYFYVQAQKIV